MFACEHWGVEPDILCLAKAVASGLPMGVTMARSGVMSAIGVGEHSSTFGGGPVACAAASATIDVILEEKLPERAARLGRCFMERRITGSSGRSEASASWSASNSGSTYSTSSWEP